MNINRGDIFLTLLDPVVGHEISKTRPAIVVSNDVGNKFSGTITIVPITSKNNYRIYPFEVFLPKAKTKLSKDSKAKADQIRTVDKSRLIKLIGKLNKELANKVDKALKVHLFMDDE